MQQLSKQSRPLIALGLILLLLATKVWFLHSNFQNVLDQEFWVSHTAEVIGELELTLSASKDAETGVRGYLLTAKEDYLEPYSRGTEEALSHIKKVLALTEDNAEQHTSALAIESNLHQRFGVLERLRVSFRDSHGKLSRDSLYFTEGKALMDRIRAQVQAMKDRERTLLSQRSNAAEWSKKLFHGILYFANILLALVLSFAFVQLSKNIAQQVAEARAKALEANHKSLQSSFATAVAGTLSLEEACQNVLNHFATTFGFLAGKLYLGFEGRLRVAASYGSEAVDDLPKTVNGLPQAAFEKATLWQVQDIPQTYWRISSGLGESRPTMLLFVPITFQGMCIGVVELACFRPLEANQIGAIAPLPEIIGVGIQAAYTRSRLQTLLETTQQQSEELQAQQEELRSSNEELEQQARALESQQQALSIKNKELESTRAQLESRARDLERTTQYKSEFLAKMSHELRTPLNGLLILSTLLVENKEKNLTPQQKEFAKSISNAGNDLLMLINDILDLSKIEARKLTLRPESFSLSQVFESLRIAFEPQAAAKGIELGIRLPEKAEEISIFTDRQRLDQVLRNFISNAIKFTQHGSVTLSAHTGESKAQLTIAVGDTGIGIPTSKQNLIFEAFEQADGSVSRQYGGTGLGLTISRELAALLGGSISLKSEEGIGSTFSLTIPTVLPTGTEIEAKDKTLIATSPRLQKPSHTASANRDVQPQVDAALANITSDKTILIVEDDARFRVSVAAAVKSYGFEPVEAADGEIALGVLKTHTPSAILLDIKLPGISGLGILEMIKHMPHLRHIPVHMISAMDHQQSALRMGAFGYLTKPVTIDKVRSAIARIEKLLSSKLRRVLLIEDDPTQTLAVSQLISGSDIEVVTVETGRAAIERLKKDTFDCIILDLTLPDVSGFDLLEELKCIEISLPPIVIYTGKDLTPEEDGYLRNFSESIIIKGARSPERLLDEVNLFLHRVESLLPESTREMLSSLRSQEASFEGKTVLVVDDDIRNIFALTSALETRGFSIQVARDGIEALKMIETHPQIDLVLMDMMMPKMDGFEAIRRIRSNENTVIRDIPVVALTAKAMKEDHEKCIEAGASDYLPKPVNLENLMTILKVWLSPKGVFA